MIILPQIKELQRGDLADIVGSGGSLSSGYYRTISGTFSSVGSDITEIICRDFTATLSNTGPAFQSSYSYQYPNTWSRITSNSYLTVPSVTLNSGSSGGTGGTGGGGGGTAGGGATAGGNGGSGGSGGPGLVGRRWDEQTLANNNTTYGAAGSGGTGFLGAAGSPSVNGVNGSNGTVGSSGGAGGTGGITTIPSAPAGGAGGAGGGGGGGGQSIFIRYSYPSYINQNMDTLPTPNSRFHGNGGSGASGVVASGGGTAGSAGSIPNATWPSTNSRSGSAGPAGVLSPTADAIAGDNGGTVTIAGPNASSFPSTGTPSDLGTPADTFTFCGG